MFREVASGAKTERAQLRRLLDQRLGGRCADRDAARPAGAIHPRPLNTLSAITDKKALGDTWANTTTSHRRLMLTVLGGLAEFERDLIRARTGEGRARAVARGQKMGRQFKLTDHQKREAVKRRNQGETLADIARSYMSVRRRFHGSRPDLPSPICGSQCHSYCLDRVK